MSQIEIHTPGEPMPIVHVNASDRIAGMMEQVIAAGVTKDGAEAIASLCKTFREMESENAKKAFNRAFAAFQRECPQVAVSKAVPMKGGGIKFRFAPFESIMDEVGPILQRHGFSVSNSTDYRSDPLRVVARCTLIHDDGHERTADFACRIGGGAPGLSAGQEDQCAATMAIRRAFCAVCNIVITQDTDARTEGEQITPAEAADLEQRVGRVTGGDAGQMARYMRLAGADRWADIRRERYEVVLAQLEQEEARVAPAAAPAPKGKPFPGSFEDAAGWYTSMLDEMETRWGCPRSAAKTVLDGMVQKAGATSYLALDAGKRRAAWERLTIGQLDNFKPKG